MRSQPSRLPQAHIQAPAQSLTAPTSARPRQRRQLSAFQFFSLSAFLTVATLTNNHTDNQVQVTAGGLIDVGSVVLGDNAALILSVDGASSSLQRDSVTFGTSATLATTVGNGGTYQVHDAVAESLTLNDGGTLHITSLDTDSSYKLDNLTALTFASGATIKSDVALSDASTFTVSSGHTIDVSSGGSFDSAFTLDGGTVAVADFNLATDNLTFTSGTLDTSGTLTLSGTNTYSGGTTISNGTLQADTDSLKEDITNHASLTFDQSSSGTFSDVISGTTSVSNGTLAVDATGSISHSNATMSVGTVDGDTAHLSIADGGSVSAGGSLAVTVANLSGSTGILNIGEGGSAGAVNTPFINGGSGTATVNFNHADSDYHLTTNGTSSGTDLVLKGSLTVNHLGSGITTLDGTDTYTGTTTISSRTLAATNVNLGTGTVTLDGGTLYTTT